MLLASFPRVAVLTQEWLVSRTFTFRAEPSGTVVSETFAFHRNGFVIGYAHPNEKFWDMEADTVRILDENGKPTCILRLRISENGKSELAGFFCNPDAEYLPTDVTHILEENGSDFHARIQSFDLFDTLVARRCFDPLAVFRNIEMKSGVAGFAERRHEVEMKIFGRRTYGLDDIYELLVAEAFLTPKQAQVLRLMELEEEWEMLFPISEIIAYVNPGDIIISDMYLPFAFVQRVLKEKCGLDNKLYLSNYGKHLRQIWPGILEQHSIRGHYGDNVHADVVGPFEFGIQPMYVTISKWSKAEEILHSAGLSSYAHALRQTRLETFRRVPQVANALNAQLSVNIPLMLLGTFWIRHCAQNFGADKILTSARDCNLWHEMISSSHFARSGMPAATYIKISRTVCHEESDGYEAYLRSKMGARNLLVDMVGTGKSLGTLVERLDLQDRMRPCILVADPAAAERVPTVETFVQKGFLECRIFMEGMNASLEGSTVAAVSDQNGTRILTQPNEFGEMMRNIITESRGLFQRFMTDLNSFQPPRSIPPLAVLRVAADGLTDQLPDQAWKLETLVTEQGSNLRRGSIANVASA